MLLTSNIILLLVLGGSATRLGLLPHLAGRWARSAGLLPEGLRDQGARFDLDYLGHVAQLRVV